MWWLQIPSVDTRALTALQLNNRGSYLLTEIWDSSNLQQLDNRQSPTLSLSVCDVKQELVGEDVSLYPKDDISYPQCVSVHKHDVSRVLQLHRNQSSEASKHHVSLDITALCQSWRKEVQAVIWCPTVRRGAASLTVTDPTVTHTLSAASFTPTHLRHPPHSQHAQRPHCSPRLRRRVSFLLSTSSKWKPLWSKVQQESGNVSPLSSSQSLSVLTQAALHWRLYWCGQKIKGCCQAEQSPEGSQAGIEIDLICFYWDVSFRTRFASLTCQNLELQQ